MFKVNNKDTRTTPMASCSSVSIVHIEQLNADWDMRKVCFKDGVERPQYFLKPG